MVVEEFLNQFPNETFITQRHNNGGPIDFHNLDRNSEEDDVIVTIGS